MSRYEDAARLRLAAIELLQERLAAAVSDMERELLAGLISRIADLQTDPAGIAALLDEFTQVVHLPVLQLAGQLLLQLPELQLSYFATIGETGAPLEALRAPLTGYLRTVYGLGADGEPLAGGLLRTYAGNDTVKRALLQYAYTAQAQGLGLNEYRAGLTALVTGGPDQSGGLYADLHRGAYDEYNRADRVLHTIGAEQLGYTAYLYLGGLVKQTRAFCKVRNGKVFLAEEIARFGSKADTYGGYTNKAAGEFAGKSEPYAPLADMGGYRCRHGLNAVSNTVALSLRPELREDAQGRLVLGNAD